MEYFAIATGVLHIAPSEFWKMTTSEFDMNYYGYLLANNMLRDDGVDDIGEYPTMDEVEEMMAKFPDKPASS